jgi:ankyrin repeat protein
MNPLHAALAEWSPVQAIERLLAADPAAALAPGNGSQLPIHLAAYQGRTDVVRALRASAPATATARCAEDCQWTPLNYAVYRGQIGTTMLLLEAAPATALMQDVCGCTPLHWVAGKGDAAMVQALVEAVPSSATLRGNGGFTPLQRALRWSHIAAARLLLLGPTPELQTALAGCGGKALPLYADLAASRPLTTAQ